MKVFQSQLGKCHASADFEMQFNFIFAAVLFD